MEFHRIQDENLEDLDALDRLGVDSNEKLPCISKGDGFFEVRPVLCMELQHFG